MSETASDEAARKIQAAMDLGAELRGATLALAAVQEYFAGTGWKEWPLNPLHIVVAARGIKVPEDV